MYDMWFWHWLAVYNTYILTALFAYKQVGTYGTGAKGMACLALGAVDHCFTKA